METMDVRHHICFNLGRAMRRVAGYYESRLAPFGLTPQQFFVFNALWLGDGITLKDLSERVFLDSSTLTGIIDRTEAAGFVERQTHPEDRRALRIILTGKARELGPTILQFADELDAAI